MIKRITLYDVAKAAGVSHQTVSRVINNYPHVAPHTRKRVLRAIQDLGYQPNRAAQVLNTQRSHILEVVTTNIYSSSAATITSISFTAKELGYQVTVAALPPDDLRSFIAGMSARLVDGLLVNCESIDIPDDELQTLTQGTPVVKLKGEPGPDLPLVGYDQAHGMRAAVQHLIECGHRQIAELHGPLDLYDARARHAAWQHTLTARGLQPGPSAGGDFSEKSGYDALCQLLDDGAPFSAVCAANDSMAQGALFALHERGLRVPHDVSLVGFDDVPAAAYYTVPLTTVRQDHALVGRLAVEYLVSLIEKPDTPVYQRVLLPELVVRHSTRRLE